MADVKPLKLVDAGGGQGQLREFAAGDTLPAGSLPPNVAALAGLAGVADRLPYFSGAGALSLATLTAFARTLLDDADAAAMQATLELVKQASATDTTAGALMMVGAFGLCGSTLAPQLNGQDLDTLVTGGYWNCTGPINAPAGSTSTHHVLVLADATGSGRHVQIAQVATASTWYWRSQIAGVWSDWVKMYHSGNILGTVTQSSGVPTGAIIEQSSNANGTYTRYAGNTQICRGSTGTITIAAAANTTQAITCPAAFAAAPYIFPNIRSTLPDRFRVTASQTSGTAGTVAVYNSGASTSGIIDWIAIGPWY